MRKLGLCVVGVLASLACSDGRGPVTSIVHPTLVGVSPKDFLGEVPCRPSAGAMRRYSATLFDVSDDQPVDAFPLPSSTLVPCTKDVTFSFVRPGHRYVAVVRGYDRTDLEQQRPGSPHATDASGKVIEPRWTTECGRAPLDLEELGTGGQGGQSSMPEDDESDTDADDMGSAGAGAVGSTLFGVEGVTSNTTFTVHTNYCKPLRDRGPASPTAVRVELGDSLRDLSCGTESGQVFEFSVRLLGDAGEEQLGACDEALVFSGLEPGVDVSFEVQAFSEASSSPSWQTECRARPEDGTTVTADCDPLSEVDP